MENKWKCVWPSGPQMKEILVTLYRHQKKEEYDDKDWFFFLEDVSKSGKRNVVAQLRLNLKDFAAVNKTKHNLTLSLTSSNKKVTKAKLTFALTSELMLDSELPDKTNTQSEPVVTTEINTENPIPTPEINQDTPIPAQEIKTENPFPTPEMKPVNPPQSPEMKPVNPQSPELNPSTPKMQLEILPTAIETPTNQTTTINDDTIEKNNDAAQKLTGSDQNDGATEQNVGATDQNDGATEQNVGATEQNDGTIEQNVGATEQNGEGADQNGVATDQNDEGAGQNVNGEESESSLQNLKGQTKKSFDFNEEEIEKSRRRQKSFSRTFLCLMKENIEQNVKYAMNNKSVPMPIEGRIASKALDGASTVLKFALPGSSFAVTPIQKVTKLVGEKGTQMYGAAAAKKITHFFPDFEFNFDRGKNYKKIFLDFSFEIFAAFNNQFCQVIECNTEGEEEQLMAKMADDAVSKLFASFSSTEEPGAIRATKDLCSAFLTGKSPKPRTIEKANLQERVKKTFTKEKISEITCEDLYRKPSVFNSKQFYVQTKYKDTEIQERVSYRHLLPGEEIEDYEILQSDRAETDLYEYLKSNKETIMMDVTDYCSTKDEVKIAELQEKIEQLLRDKSNESLEPLLTTSFGKFDMKEYLWQDKNSISVGDLFPKSVEKSAEPLNFLINLFKLDSRCRKITSDAEEKEAKASESSSFDEIFSSAEESKDDDQVKMSIRDSIVVALAACDDFLIQEVFQKMSACQVAIPVLMPTLKFPNNYVYHLWASRTISKHWIQNKLTPRESLVVSEKVKTISFVRLGDFSPSKSKLINTFVTTEQGVKDQPTIFLTKDHDCRSELSQGTIEMCWFVPEGQDSEHLTDLTLIYNLRGDGKTFTDQRKFLENISSCVVYLVEDRERDLDKKTFEEIKNSESQSVILLTSAKGKDHHNTKDNLKILFGEGRNLAGLANLLTSNIQLENTEVNSMVDHATVATKYLLKVDEDTDYHKNAKEKSDKLLRYIQDIEDVQQRKGIILPRQGQLWKDFSELEREGSKLKRMQEDHNTYKDRIRRDKKEKRRQQRILKESPAFSFFLDSVTTGDEKERRFFLQWVQYELNKLSESIMPDILKRYNESKRELDRIKSMTNETEEIMQEIQRKEKKLLSIIDEFEKSSFGLEHFFREIGQLYEANLTLRDQTKNRNLPTIMADLVSLGHPLELMDGNVSCVPLEWIKAVLDELDNKLKKPRVSVTSVLGIQSTGKSTLLNTMFGSKFAVSSGRCTKGVYMQLLPVKKIRQLELDYLLVMDTEGLRSPELGDKVDRDNEIATFASCLANTTIINFWGQTFTKDMKEIMEIVAHAYLRMKKVELKSATHLIFAGVSDVTAEEKNELGVSKVLEEMNKIIKNAAENVDRVITGREQIFPLCREIFSDLEFPQFLPSLWQGPMSSPVSRYGEKLALLREELEFFLV